MSQRKVLTIDLLYNSTTNGLELQTPLEGSLYKQLIEKLDKSKDPNHGRVPIWYHHNRPIDDISQDCNSPDMIIGTVTTFPRENLFIYTFNELVSIIWKHTRVCHMQFLVDTNESDPLSIERVVKVGMVIEYLPGFNTYKYTPYPKQSGGK